MLKTQRKWPSLVSAIRRLVFGFRFECPQTYSANRYAMKAPAVPWHGGILGGCRLMHAVAGDLAFDLLQCLPLGLMQILDDEDQAKHAHRSINDKRVTLQAG